MGFAGSHEGNEPPCCERVKVRLFRKSHPKKQVRKLIAQQPIIQLSQYPRFTGEIVERCKCMFEIAIADLRDIADSLTQRLVDADSPWLKLLPVMVTGPPAGTERASSEVEVECDIDGFLNALVALFLQHVPSPKALTRVHEGVTVGTEKETALAEYERLQAESRKIETARDGIRQALSIDDVAFEEMKRAFDEEMVDTETQRSTN